MAFGAPVRRKSVLAGLAARSCPFPVVFDAGRYSPAYLRQGLLEEAVQLACIDYLRAKWRAEVTVIDVGDAALRGRAAGLIAAAGGDPRRLSGKPGEMKEGIVDLAVTFPGGRAGWFELKRPVWMAPSPTTGKLVVMRAAGAPTDEQVRFLARQHRAGALAGVLWGTSDLDALLPAPGRRMS